ncbi:trans-aconitate methyltransferase [Crossiella equi]|uniref:Trans-aconitate methyltransferase n=1 Tax=Crossiella equi TaxID=130796 RepID=A0ABS5ABR0_9PSEU|nr:class I SAM-dependent methyltransferase [Crossiella equi]MBP2473727.1 trans-aconitate methyltransferase [Crossiella equi]
MSEHKHGHGHGHGHGHDDAFDWSRMADLLENEGEVHSPYVRQAFDELRDLRPRRVLDIGAGPGVAACRLAEVFPEAEVVAVDGSAELLHRAQDRAKRLGVRLTTVQAEFPDDLASLGEADLVWSGQVVHHVGDQLGTLRQLAGLLRPGGVLAIVEGGLPARFLPRDLGFGTPGFQVRLDLAQNERFNRMREELPGTVRVVEHWPALLLEAGLVQARTRTFLVEHQAPVADGVREHVRKLLERYESLAGEQLSEEDATTLARLLDPADPAGVDNRADVFLTTAKSVHYGRKP